MSTKEEVLFAPNNLIYIFKSNSVKLNNALTLIPLKYKDTNLYLVEIRKL